MDVLQSLVAAFKTDLAKDVLPIFVGDLQAIEVNPDLILNPLSQPAKVAKLQGDLMQAMAPSGQFERDMVSGVIALVVAYMQNVKVPLAQKAKAAAKPA
jgi:hypothetical protein